MCLCVGERGADQYPQPLKCIERELAGQSGNESGRVAPTLFPAFLSQLVQEQICPITGSKEALFPANGITSHTGGGIITTLILRSLSKADDLDNTHTQTHVHSRSIEN